MRAMLIFNPTAGQRHVEEELRAATHYLEDIGWQLTFRATHGPGDATTHAREAARAGFDLAIAAGGDGTIGQVVNGIARTDTALGVVPVGTANVWAREVGLPIAGPLNPRAVYDAVELLGAGTVHTVDLGMVNDRYFLMWAGVGFDAHITRQVDERPQQKRRLGMLAYVLPALTEPFQWTGTRARIVIDGKKINRRIVMLVASNIQLYAAMLRIAPLASVSDGFLDVRIFAGYTGISAYMHFLRLLAGGDTRNPELLYRQAQHITVRSRRTLPVHADGDVVGETPVDIRSVPGALRVLLPPNCGLHGLRDLPPAL